MAKYTKRLFFLLCVVLLLVLLAPTVAMAKAEGMLSADLNGFFGWFYCTRNIPEGRAYGTRCRFPAPKTAKRFFRDPADSTQVHLTIPVALNTLDY